MRTYETVFIIKPDLGPEALNEQIEFYKENITKNGGEILSVEPWGKLTLAYKVERYSEGVYVLIQFNADIAYIAELERRYKFNENVLRHAIVMIDEKKFKLKPRKEAVRRERRPRRDANSEDAFAEEFSEDAEIDELEASQEGQAE